MPVYQYQCPKCLEMCEEMHGVEDRYNAMCVNCGVRMEIIITRAPNHPKELLRYFDAGLGCYVNDRAERKRIMKEKGLREAGDHDHPITLEMKRVREEDVERNHRR